MNNILQLIDLIYFTYYDKDDIFNLEIEDFFFNEFWLFFNMEYILGDREIREI
jgi:hypothetical protein